MQGTWLGKLTKQVEPPFNEYRFRLKVVQIGDRVIGTSHISVPDHLEWNATMEITGTVHGNTLSFQETQMLKGSHNKDMTWCLKSALLELKVNGGLYRMDGNWTGSNGEDECAPGQIMLERLNPNPPKMAAEVMKKKTYGALDGRDITHQREVKIYRKSILLQLWDADKVDGDIVSLSFNGKWLVRNYPIKKAKKTIEVVLDPNADNRLILYAENEGHYPPNTAALTFFDGKKQRNLSLVSTKSTCGAIKFEFVGDQAKPQK